MKKITLVYIPLLLLLVTTLDAITYKDRGLYGSLSYSYIEDIYYDERNTNAQDRIIQEYKLGYKGNIYSPKLLEYTLETTFRYDDITNQNAGYDSKSKIESQDYKVNANFIKSTKIPFYIYYNTTNRPTSFIYGNTVSKYTQELESKGIHGSVNFGLFTLNYQNTYSDDIFETDTSVDYRTRKYSELSVSKNQKNYNLKLTYSHLDQSTTSKIFNVASSTISELYDRANITYRWKISDSLRLNANMSYFDSKYLLSESISANAHLSWTPKTTNYSASISANTTSINQNVNDTNEFGDSIKKQDTITTSGMSQSFAYRITKNLNFSETLSYLNYESISSSGENTSINLGLSYALNINKSIRGSLSGNVSARDSKINVANSNDLNSTISDEQSTSYNLNAGISKQFESAESRLALTIRYSGTQSSQNRNNDNAMLNLSLTSKFWNALRNNFIVNYSVDNSNYTTNFSVSESTTSTVSRISASDSLNYNSRLGIKGNIVTSLGASYSKIDNNGNEITRIIPKLNLSLQYRFWQRLKYKLNLGVYKDLSYDFINYFTGTGISYEIGKTAFSMNYNYNMTGYEKSDKISSIEKSKLDVKIIRRF